MIPTFIFHDKYGKVLDIKLYWNLDNNRGGEEFFSYDNSKHYFLEEMVLDDFQKSRFKFASNYNLCSKKLVNLSLNNIIEKYSKLDDEGKSRTFGIYIYFVNEEIGKKICCNVSFKELFENCKFEDIYYSLNFLINCPKLLDYFPTDVINHPQMYQLIIKHFPSKIKMLSYERILQYPAVHVQLIEHSFDNIKYIRGNENIQKAIETLLERHINTEFRVLTKEQFDENEKLQKKYDGLKEEYDALLNKQKDWEKQEEADDMKFYCESLQKSHEELHKLHEELKKEHEKLQQLNEELHDEYNSLHNEHDILLMEYNKLNEEVNRNNIECEKIYKDIVNKRGDILNDIAKITGRPIENIKKDHKKIEEQNSNYENKSDDGYVNINENKDLETNEKVQGVITMEELLSKCCDEDGKFNEKKLSEYMKKMNN